KFLNTKGRHQLINLNSQFFTDLHGYFTAEEKTANGGQVGRKPRLSIGDGVARPDCSWRRAMDGNTQTTGYCKKPEFQSGPCSYCIDTPSKRFIGLFRFRQIHHTEGIWPRAFRYVRSSACAKHAGT